MMQELWLFVPMLCLTMYIVLDGYDLGIGILMLFERDRDRRRDAVEVVSQAWDINESWIILLGVSLWAGFPMVFGASLPHLYLPVIAMLLCLAIRGFSTELLSQRRDAPQGWMWAFCLGSLGAALAQGAALGTLTQAMLLDDDGTYLGTESGFLPGIAALTAVATAAVYAALGAAYLLGKVDSPYVRRVARPVLAGAAILLVAVFALLPTTDAPLSFSGVQGIVVGGLLGLAAGAAVMAWRAMRTGGPHHRAYMWVAFLVVAVLAAVYAGRYPVLGVPGITVERAGAPDLTMIVLLVGVGVNVLLVLFYTYFAHNVFRGPLRVPPRAGYQQEERA